MRRSTAFSSGVTDLRRNGSYKNHGACRKENGGVSPPCPEGDSTRIGGCRRSLSCRSQIRRPRNSSRLDGPSGRRSYTFWKHYFICVLTISHEKSAECIRNQPSGSLCGSKFEQAHEAERDSMTFRCRGSGKRGWQSLEALSPVAGLPVPAALPFFTFEGLVNRRLSVS
jgi:hypothetical protein